MSLPRSFFTHLTLLAGNAFGVNTHQGASLLRAKWMVPCKRGFLCEKSLSGTRSYSSGACFTFFSSVNRCVRASQCTGVCTLEDDNKVFDQRDSLCPDSGATCDVGASQRVFPSIWPSCSPTQLCRVTAVNPDSVNPDSVTYFPASQTCFGKCVDAERCPSTEPVCLMDQKVLFEPGKLPNGLCPGSCGEKTRAVLKDEEEDEEVPGEDGGSVFDSDPETKEGVTSTTEDMFQKAVEENEKENKANAAFMRLLRSMDKAEIKEFLVKEIGLGRDDVNRYLKNNVLRKLSRISSFGRREVQDLYKSLASN